MVVHVSTNTASVAQLNSGIDAVTTTIVLSAPTFSGWPSTFPYWAIIARGTSVAEVVEVTAGAGSTLTATRGMDGTTAAPHNSGDTFEHIIPADTANRAEQHIDATAAHGATGAVVGTTNAQTVTSKLYQGGHKHVYTDANPAGLSAGYESVADSAAARDGFVHKNTAGDADRRGFLLEQSGTPRVEAFNDGTVKVTPAGSATRKGIETTTSIKAGTTLEVGGNTTLSGTLGVTGLSTLTGGASTNAITAPGGTLAVTGNETVSGTLGVTGASTLAGATITGTTATSTLTNSTSATFSAGAKAYGTIPMLASVGALGDIASPVTGQLAFLTTDRLIYRWTGSAWARQFTGYQILEATQTSDQTITTTVADLGGVTSTFTTLSANAECHVTASIDVQSTGGTDIFESDLLVDGASSSHKVHYKGPGRASVSGTWKIILTTAGSHTLKLRGIKVNNSDGITVFGTHTKFDILLFDV